MQDYSRTDRVNEVLKREISQLCQRYITPETEKMLTVTSVKTSPDLRNARVFVSIMGDEQDKAFVLSLCIEQRANFQRLIAKRVKLKYTPVLDFRLDETPEKADRVLSILDDLEPPQS